MSKIDIVSDILDYFEGEVYKTSQKQGLKVPPTILHYLAQLLTHFSKSTSMDPFPSENNICLGKIWLESQALNAQEKLFALQKLGDFTLFSSGFFADKYRKSIIDMDYVEAIGSRSYQDIAHLKKSSRKDKEINLFFELSEKFSELRNLFEELSLQSNLFNNKDMIKLYEKWNHTGSERIARLLGEKGIIAGKKASGAN